MAVLLLLAGAEVPAYAAEAEDGERQAERREQETPQSKEKRIYLILGGIVVGVTGMWVTLYRRGRGK